MTMRMNPYAVDNHPLRDDVVADYLILHEDEPFDTGQWLDTFHGFEIYIDSGSGRAFALDGHIPKDRFVEGLLTVCDLNKWEALVRDCTYDECLPQVRHCWSHFVDSTMDPRPVIDPETHKISWTIPRFRAITFNEFPGSQPVTGFAQDWYPWKPSEQD